MPGRAEPGGVNVTLVAGYGDKPAAMASFIAAAHGILGRLGHAFVPYRAEQVHATLVGLEGYRPAGSGEPVNSNFFALRGERRFMQLATAFELVRNSARLPFTVRIGGFERARAYPFASRGQHPYERSFSLAGDAAVAIGWPRAATTYPSTLALLRRDLEASGVLHKYHRAPDAMDNDFFFVLGRLLRGQATEEAIGAAARELRDLMGRTPLEFVVDAGNLDVVGYVDPALPLETSVRYGISNVDAEVVASLYRAEP